MHHIDIYQVKVNLHARVVDEYFEKCHGQHGRG